MHINELYQIFLKYPTVSTDTRNIKPNSLFFALKGERFNANEFAADALKAGAQYAIIDDANYQVNNHCILVTDVLKTLQELAAYHRKQLQIPVIAIVGSNGKTTTKELLTAVLSQKWNVLATPGNFNNHIFDHVKSISRRFISLVPLRSLRNDHAGGESGELHLHSVCFQAPLKIGSRARLSGFGKNPVGGGISLV